MPPQLPYTYLPASTSPLFRTTGGAARFVLRRGGKLWLRKRVSWVDYPVKGSWTYARLGRPRQSREGGGNDEPARSLREECEQTFGQVPTFLKLVPGETLELEWQLVETVRLDEGPMPNKRRDLIGLGLSPVTNCR